MNGEVRTDFNDYTCHGIELHPRALLKYMGWGVQQTVELVKEGYGEIMVDSIDASDDLTLSDLYVMSVDQYLRTNKYFKRTLVGDNPRYESLMTNEVVVLPKEGDEVKVKTVIKYVDPFEALRYLMMITSDPPELKDAAGSNLVAVLCPNGA